MDKIDILLHNLKNHPWHLYPAFKIDEETGKALLEKLGDTPRKDEWSQVIPYKTSAVNYTVPLHNERSGI